MANNAITSQFLNNDSSMYDMNFNGSQSTGGANSGEEQQLISDIEKLFSEMSSNNGSGSPQNNSPYDPATFMNKGGNQGVGGNQNFNLGQNEGQGQGGFRDVKINSGAGGEALHLKEGPDGTLYNGSGNSVGVIGADGSVTLNSGATKEINRLQTGGNPLGLPLVQGSKGDGGNVTFSSSQVSVEDGDLNQQNDF
ncbi:hypothetical protein A6V36_23975 [Paraburkholderia ginsengiterrae]|uniref:Uncharacterized protein n=1 Tax=Paraburkholderia ginsengiterrae TaxID=1462993 RepID=A0A1A9NA74_9BURK|nr:hypothetical protein [Paraburkholderia ginsengiterrae]OAJ61440.1 hypothetical protein A6V36_23975 [Paraburkholderia ginsengiterrae]OAJ62843.1 hypothetical protein A6V37_21755 [Paraburkholderia ginsengiterrae]